MPLKLVSHDLCPYVQRAAITLLEKGVPFDRINIDLSDKPAWFRAVSPRGKVPLLQTQDDAVLFESNAICEFIEETQPGPALHPQDPILRAQHRAWMEFASAILADVWGLETAKDFATFEPKRIAIADKFSWVEKALGDGPFFMEERFCLVDAAFAPVFRYFDLFETLKPLGLFDDKPRVKAWRTSLAQRPSVVAAAAPDYPALLRGFLVRHDAYLLN